MKITGDLLSFPFKDEKWFGKIAIGMLLGMVGILFFPLMWPLMGMGVRVMRQTEQGQSPSMPDWEDWGGLFKDGLRYWGVMVIYSLPIWILNIPTYALFGWGIVTFIQGIDDPELFFRAVTLWTAGTALSAIAILPGLFLSFMAFVAATRMIALDRFKSAFELKEVWTLVRQGFKHYAIAMAIYYALIMGISMAVSALSSTIVLSCLYPFMLGVIALLSRLYLGALFGMAYHEITGGVVAEAVEPAPALG